MRIGLLTVAILMAGRSAFSQEPPEQERIPFKFKDAPIDRVLDYISEKTGLKFTVDPNAKLSGRVEAYNQAPIPKDKILGFLNTILAPKGLTTYKMDDVVLILRIRDAQDRNYNIQKGSDWREVENSDKIVTQVIPIRNLRAADLEKNLRKTFPKSTDTILDPVNNLMIMRGPSRDIRQYLKLLEHLDRSSYTSLKIEMLRLEHATAHDVAEILNQIFRKEEGGQEGGFSWWRIFMGGRGSRRRTQSRGGREDNQLQETIRIIPDHRTNSVIVAATQENLDLIRDIVEKLDSESVGVSQIEVFTLRYADPKTVADALTELFRAPAEEDRNRRGPGRGWFAWVARLQDQEQRLTPRDTVRAIPDPRTGRMIVMATGNQMRLIRDLVARLDVDSSEILKIRIVPLQYAEATSLAETVQKIFEEEAPAQSQPQRRGRPGFRAWFGMQVPPSEQASADVLRIVPDARTNSIIVTAPEEKLAMVEDLIRRLDEDVLDSVVFRTYPLRFADPVEVADAITELFNEKTATVGGRRPRNIRSGPWGGLQRLARQASSGTTAQPLEVKAIADTRTNSVIVVCSRTQETLIADLVAKMDREVDELLKIKVYPLKNAEAATMAGIVRGLFTGSTTRRLANRRGQRVQASPGPTSQTVIVQTDTRTNSVIVEASPENLELVDDLIATLDRKPSEDKQTIVVPLKYVNAEDAAEILRGIRKGGVSLKQMRGVPGRIQAGGNRNNNRGGRNSGFELPNPRSGGRGRSRNLGPNDGWFGVQDPSDQESEQERPDLPIPQERPSLEDEVDVQADPSRNLLIIRTSPRNMEAIRAILAHLDRFRPQVLIRVLMAEVTLDESTEFGVEGFWENKVTTGKNDSSRGRVETDFQEATTGGFSYRLMGDEFDVRLRALAEEGKLKVLATPRILTLDNEEASINVGKQVPFVTNSRQTPEGSIINTIQYQDVGILLRVTPHVNDEGVVTMEIHPEISDIASEAEAVPISEGVTSPTFNRSAADATVAVRAGQTVVLGGLIREFKDEKTSGVPILKDIPLLGILFSNTRRVNQRRELMIFITPHVVYTQQELEELTEIEKGRLRHLDPKEVEVKGRQWRRFIRDDE